MTTERVVGDPQTEDMNNFYFYMPSGLKRGDLSYEPKSMVAIGSQFMLANFGHYLSEPENTWPPTDAIPIKKLQTDLLITKAVDEYLIDKQELKDAIEERVKTVGARWGRNDDPLIRPIYVHLREQFSQEELIA